MPHAKPRVIVIVEDEDDVGAVLSAMLSQYGHRLAIVNDKSLADAIISALRPDLVIVDAKLRGGDGEEVAKTALALDTSVLLISGDPEVIERSTGGTVSFLAKPFRLPDLQRRVEELLLKRNNHAA